MLLPDIFRKGLSHEREGTHNRKAAGQRLPQDRSPSRVRGRPTAARSGPAAHRDDQGPDRPGSDGQRTASDQQGGSAEKAAVGVAPRRGPINESLRLPPKGFFFCSPAMSTLSRILADEELLNRVREVGFDCREDRSRPPQPWEADVNDWLLAAPETRDGALYRTRRK